MASDPFFDPRRGEWVMKYRPDPLGPWVRQKLCKHPGPWSASRPPKKPPQEAVDRARHFAEVEYRARNGISAAPARARPLAEYLEAYAESHSLVSRAGSTVLLRRMIRYFLEFAADRGITSVQGVTRAHCRDFQERRLKSVKLSTLNSERGVLMGAWSRAVQDELIAANPWEGAPLPGKGVESPVTFWSFEEIGKIARACGKPWQSDLVLCLANTGIRVGTAILMTWEWIDWRAGVVKIPSTEGVKTAYTHVLGRGARDLLERRLGVSKSSHAFPGTRGDTPANYHTARYAIEQAIARAKVRPGTPHDLRHSYGRALALQGVPVTVIQRQLGHTTLAMTMRYVATEAEHSARFVADFDVGSD